MSYVARTTLLLLLLYIPLCAYSDGLEPRGQPIPKHQLGDLGKQSRAGQHQTTESLAPPKEHAPAIAADSNAGANADDKPPKSTWRDFAWWIDSPQTLFSAVLAGTTILLTVFGLRQARAVETAADAAKKSADLQETAIFRT